MAAKTSVRDLLRRAFRARDQAELEQLEKELPGEEEGQRGEQLEAAVRPPPSDDVHVHIHPAHRSMRDRDDDDDRRDDDDDRRRDRRRDYSFRRRDFSRSRFTDPDMGEGGGDPDMEEMHEAHEAMQDQIEELAADVDALKSKMGVTDDDDWKKFRADVRRDRRRDARRRDSRRDKRDDDRRRDRRDDDDRRDARDEEGTGMEGPATISTEQAEGEHKIPGNLEMEAPTGTTSDMVRKARDSALFSDSFKETAAMAEVLAPGIKLPTFDSKAPPKKTFDCMCDLRRDALELAYNTPEMRRPIDELTNNRPIGRLTSDELRTVFRAAALHKGHINTGDGGDRGVNPLVRDGYGGGTGVRSRFKTPADVAAAHRDFWNRQTGRDGTRH